MSDYAGSIDMTGFQAHAVNSVRSIAVTGIRTPTMSDFIGSIALTGSRPAALSEVELSSALTGSRAPALSNLPRSLAVVNSLGSRQYEYGPAILATGFAKPGRSESFVTFSNIP